MELKELLKFVTTELEKKGIEYMLSGSVAMSTYTIPRMTRDIDIVLELKEDQVEDFASIFEDRFYIYKEGIREEIHRRGMFNVIDNESGYKIDFIIRKNTEFNRTEFKRKIRGTTFGLNVWIVSIEDLILSKFRWMQDSESQIQKEDVSHLLENKTIDYKYLEKWIKELNLNTFNLLE